MQPPGRLAAMIALAACVVRCFSQSVYTPYTFSTLAGSAGQSGSEDGTGDAARFSSPVGLAVDGGGTLFVVDYNADVRKVTPQGAVTTLPAGLDNPNGVAVDGATNIYVANSFDHTIVKVSPEGVVTTLAGVSRSEGSEDGTGSGARFYYPSSVAVDGAGNVYVADTSNNEVRKVTPAGEVTTLAGKAQFDGLGNPVGGNVDATGADARFNAPWGVAVDDAGILYVADTSNNEIRKVTPAGVVTTLAGKAQFDGLGSPVGGNVDATGTAARFDGPFALAVDSTGNVYVADRNNHLIRKVTPAGVVTTLAGLASNPGSADGTGSEAQFNMPSGVAVDKAGSLYVADSSNHTIRKGFPAQTGCLLSGPGFAVNRGPFGFRLTGPFGALVVVEASTNFANWLPLWTNTFSGALDFSDLESDRPSHRFYRARLP